MTVGERIKQRRKEIHMTQTQLAESMNTVRQAIYEYEHDKVDIPLSKLKLVAKGLNTTLFELIQDELF